MNKDRPPSLGSSAEFNPDVSKINRVGVRIQLVQHSTKALGQSRWLDALELDVADGQRTGLDLDKMVHEAYRDIGRDARPS